MKNKKYELYSIIILFLIFLVGPHYIIKYTGEIYYQYLFKPLIFVSIALAGYILIDKNKKIYNFNRSAIRQMAIIGGLLYIILYYLIGLAIGYAVSPLSHTMLAIMGNIICFLVIAVAQEVIRASYIKTDKLRNNTMNIILITALFTIFDIGSVNISETISGSSAIFTFLLKDFFPALIANMFLGYLVYREGLVSALLYKIPFLIVFLLTPVFPANNYAIICIVNAFIPLIIYLKLEKDYFSYFSIYIKQKISESDKVRFFVFIISLCIIITFTLGFFPISPVVVLTGSMEPVIKKGDIVVYEDINYKDINIGDIIVYNLDSIRVIHRVIEFKIEDNGERSLITKGDNNSSRDMEAVLENQVVGKLILIVPDLGYPTIWFNEITSGNSNTKIGVETGD